MSPVSDVAVPAEHFRAAMAAFPSGVTAVAALRDGIPVGIAASSFTSVSLDPPLVSVCVAHSSTTWPLMAGLPRIGVTVLSHDQGPVARALAGKGDRFGEVPWRATDGGAVVVEGGTAWFECTTEHVFRAGDHDIVVLRVRDLHGDPSAHPLVFHGREFRRLGAGET